MIGDTFLAASCLGAVVALALSFLAIARAPARLDRENYRKARVPAVLGIAIFAGALAGIALVRNMNEGHAWPGDTAIAVLAVVVLLALGGLADDLRGDERAKGFRGHLAAAARGRITGGFVKIVAGGVAGLAAGFIVSSGRAAIEIALLVALSANLVNLLDRAPGRATKISLVVAIVLGVSGPTAWALGSAGLWGAACAVFYFDLRERGMLGDAGANPMGGVLGLGLGVTLGEPGRLVALVVLLALNAASEKWSFSAVIERNFALRAFDRLGRS